MLARKNKVLPEMRLIKGEKEAACEGQLLYLTHNDLMFHPRNLRRSYPESDVKKMAASIKARGIIHALIVFPSEIPGKYYVADGNVRLAGAKLLGNEAPLLKCEVVSMSQAQQYLDMVITSEIRFDPDPISKAIHFRRIIEEEGYSDERISQKTGVHSRTIKAYMKLLDLDEPIQQLVADKRLPSDARVTDALLSIPDSRARVKIAQRLVENDASIKTILAACEKLKGRIGAAAAPHEEGTPSLRLARGRAFGKDIKSSKVVPLKGIRAVMGAVCRKCDLKMESALEPAWSLIAHSALETCGTCELRKIESSCGQCPAVDLLRRLIASMGGRCHE